jgi:vacuolar-type H+-ATPase subunit E/Vma4
MALDAILTRIQDETDTQVRAIIQEARLQAVKSLEAGRQEADKSYHATMLAAKNLAAQKKKRALVICRLENRKKILKTKEEILDHLFEKVQSHLKKGKLKKQVVSVRKRQEVPEDIGFYLEKLRRDIETELAQLLFS